MKIKFKNEKIYKEGDSENYTRNITYYTKDGTIHIYEYGYYR